MREDCRLGSWCAEGGLEPRGVCEEDVVMSNGCKGGSWCVMDGGPGDRSSTDEVSVDGGGGGGGL